MKTLKFKVQLESDVILNMKSATEGSQQSLDFIPGNVFLGIVASQQYAQLSVEESYLLFHSSKVRFGDAHLSKDGEPRGLKIPASLYYPKLEPDAPKVVHHYYKRENDITKAQLKQCRSGYYVFNNTKAEIVDFSKNFVIKSAYDSENRCSAKSQMYGYESIQKGSLLYFSVEVDDEHLIDIITKSLVGNKQIGRSRTAQYGLVDISICEFNEVASGVSNTNIDADAKKAYFTTVYADGRLIFVDETGTSTFRPSAQQLGFGEDASINWKYTQIRTFQYAPWNGKRRTYDMDRCGIEKGSVIVVEHDTQLDFGDAPKYIGSYNNEGFGEVIYNPSFLEVSSSADANGKSTLNFVKNDSKDKELEKDATVHQDDYCYDDIITRYTNKKDKEIKALCNSSQIVLKVVGERLKNDALESLVYDMVKLFVDKNSSMFSGAKLSSKFASQWGNIRSIAISNTEDKNVSSEIDKYIGHGVKSTDWKGRREKALSDFMDVALDYNILRIAVINLASQMAKKTRK